MVVQQQQYLKQEIMSLRHYYSLSQEANPVFHFMMVRAIIQLLFHKEMFLW